MNKNYIKFNSKYKTFVVDITRVDFRKTVNRKTKKRFERNMILKVYGSLSISSSDSIKEKFMSEFISKIMQVMNVPAPKIKVIKTETIINLAKNNPNLSKYDKETILDLERAKKLHPYCTLLEKVGNKTLLKTGNSTKTILTNKSIRSIGRIVFAELLLLKIGDRHSNNYMVKEDNNKISQVYSIDFEDVDARYGIEYKISSSALHRVVGQIIKTDTINDDLQFIKGLNDARTMMIKKQNQIVGLAMYYGGATPVDKKDAKAILRNMDYLKKYKLGQILKLISESSKSLENEMKKDIYLL